MEDPVARGPCSLDELASRMRKPGMGALVSYVGTVRDATGRLGSFEVSAASGAEEELGRIRRDALSRFEVSDAAIRLNPGSLRTGDTVLVVLVGAAHRGPAFDACSFIVDEFKRARSVTCREVW